jgi:hypothetical protein
MLTEILKKSLPIFEVTLPASNKKYKFRPMTVKEEKNLLLAQSEGSVSSMAKAMKNIIENCYHDIKDAGNLSLIDAQMAYLNLRSKSVSEVFDFQIICPETNEKINLKCDISLFKPNEKIENIYKVKFGNGMVLLLKSPDLNYYIEKETDDDLKKLFANCFVEFQTSTDSITKNDTSEDDIEEFFDSLTMDQYNILIEFFRKIPKLELELPYKTKDGVSRSVKFNGIDSFFELASVI